MVALQPDFEKVTELAVGGYLCGREVTVVIEDGLTICVAMVEVAGVLIAQKEIVVDECHKNAGKSIVAYGGRAWPPRAADYVTRGV